MELYSIKEQGVAFQKIVFAFFSLCRVQNLAREIRYCGRCKQLTLILCFFIGIFNRTELFCVFTTL